MAKLGEICEIVSGSTPKTNNEEFWNGDLCWITPAEITDKDVIISDTERKISEAGAKSCALTLMPIGTVLLSSRAPIGKVAITGKEMYCNQGFKNLICSELIINKYLFYFLKNNNEYLNSLGRGATFKEISKKIVADIEIPLPCLETQKQIAANLDKVTHTIDLCNNILEKLDLLVKSRFVEMFGNNEYPYQELISLIIEGAGLSYGIVVPGDNVIDGIPMVRPSDFKNGYLDLSNVYMVEKSIESKYAKTRLNGEEILVQVIGQPGQIMLTDKRCIGMNVTRNLAVIRPNNRIIDRIYLSEYLKKDESQRFMIGETKQSTLKQLPLNRLKQLKVPIPPLELQEQFAAFVEQTDKSKSSVKQVLEKAETLKNALMQEYFG